MVIMPPPRTKGWWRISTTLAGLVVLVIWNALWIVRQHPGIVMEQDDSNIIEAPSSNVPVNNATTPDRRPTNKILISDIMNRNNLTILSGYWKIPGNPKNSLSQFQTDVQKTLKFFARWATNRQIHIYYHHNIDLASHEPNEAAWRSLIQEYAHSNNNHLHFVYTPLSSLLQDPARQLVTLCQAQNLTSYGKFDKALQHKRQMAKAVHFSNSTHAWSQIIAVWISKLELMRRHLADTTTTTPYIAWLDGALEPKLLAGLARRYMDDDDAHVYFRPSITTLNHSKIQFRAGVILGAIGPMQRLVEDYRNEWQDILKQKDKLCYDEEGILTRMWNRHPNDYMTVWKDWKKA